MGGEKEGLFKVAYHVGIDVIVKGVAAKPTSSQTRIDIKSFPKFFTYLSISIAERVGLDPVSPYSSLILFVKTSAIFAWASFSR